MAVSGVGSSRSIYGRRNVISGLASGMDTESMIENAVSAYKNKITALNKNRVKTEWKQTAYRSMISKMSSFLSKYTSYRSANNLMSSSFFDQAVKTVSKGANKDLISAVGRASSDVRIDRVKQLATAATYKLSGTALDSTTSTFGDAQISASASGTMDLDKSMEISGFSGNMTLAYGGKNTLSYLSINFDETKTYDSAQDLADEINRQLETQSVSIGSKTYTGKELLDNIVKAEVSGDSIRFTDPKGNNVYISSASDSVKKELLGGQELSSKDGKQVKTLNASADVLKKEEMSTYEYLVTRGGSMEITLDGKTKTIKLPTPDEIINKLDTTGLTDKEIESLKKALKDDPRALTKADRQERRDKAFIAAFQDKIDAAFGKNSDGTSKLTVSNANADGSAGKGVQFQFETKQNGSTFSVYSTKGEVLGFGEGKQVTSYLNTNKTLGELMKGKDFSGFEKAYVLDDYGNPTSKLAVDSNGKQLYSFKVNGKEVGQFNEDSKLSEVFNAMNNNSASGVKVGYSKLTNELTFSAKETGENSGVSFDGFSAALFGSTDTTGLTPDKDGIITLANGGKLQQGQDAIFEATVNGTSLGELTRSSNDVQMDGMTVTLKGTFGYEAVKDADGNVTGYNKVDTEAVTFETSSDADKIVEVVKQMVEDYNAMAKEIKDAYSTLPAQRSNGAYYEPLSAEEEEGESESFIKNWNEKAQQGILFGDRDLATLYQRMTSAISMTGEHGDALRAAGITVSYSNGLSTLEFNEEKFRNALNNDPDKVRDAFTASTEAGASQNGLMQALKQPLDTFGKTEGGKGVLVEKAGSPLAPSTMYNNTIQQELNRIDEEIERWQDKMENQIDHYTNQFSRLEQLIAQMNSQSSYFSQLMGG